MKIALFGATGHTGKYLLQEALQRGHQVTASVRTPGKITIADKNLTVIEGDILKPSDVAAAIQRADVVVSAVSEGLGVHLHTQSEGTHNLIMAMQQAGVSQLICMGATGILQFNEQQLNNEQPWFPAMFNAVSDEHKKI